MAAHLALVLAGAGYGPDGPVLTVPSDALAQCGAEVVVVPYPAFRPGRGEVRDGEFLDLVHSLIAGIVAEHRPDRLTFVAKSLGCEVVATLPPSKVAASRVEVLWLTPVFGLDHIRDGAIAKAWPSLVVSGDADAVYDAAGTRAVVDATGGTALILPGADHSLVVEGDVLATVDGWRRLAEAVLGFSTAAGRPPAA